MRLNEIVRPRPDVRVDVAVLMFFRRRRLQDIERRSITPNVPVVSGYFDYYTDTAMSFTNVTPHNQPLIGKWNVHGITIEQLFRTFNQALEKMIEGPAVTGGYDYRAPALVKFRLELQARLHDLLRIFVYGATESYNPCMVVVMRTEGNK